MMRLARSLANADSSISMPSYYFNCGKKGSIYVDGQNYV